MGQDINIDFSPLTKTADPVGNYVNAFQIGRKLAGEQIAGNAMQAYMVNPTAPLDPRLGAANPELAVQMQGRQAGAAAGQAIAKGDYAGAAATPNLPLEAVMQIKQSAATMAGTQLDQATKMHEILGNAAAGVLHNFPITPGTDPQQVMAQRKSASLAFLQSAGYPPQLLQMAQNADYSDAGLSALSQSNLGAAKIYEEERQAKQDAESHRHNLAEEGKPQYVMTKDAQGNEIQTLVNPDAVRGAQGGSGGSGGSGGASSGGGAQNNPGNIKALPQGMWDGQTGVNANGTVNFSTPEAGQAAAEKNLISYQTHHGLTTLTGIISRWAPASDHNDPAGYAAQVAKAVGVSPDQKIDLVGNPQLRRSVLQAMYQVEGNNRPYQVASNGATPPPPGGAIGGTPRVIGAPTNSGAATEAAAKGLTGDQYLAVLTPQERPIVKAIAEGRMQLPTSFAMTKPYWQDILQKVSQYDPSFDAANPTARIATRKAFTSGAPAANITSINTVINHLGRFYDNIDKLDNGPIQPVNALVQGFRGATGDTRYEAANDDRQALSSELVRTLRGVGGTEQDIKEWQKKFDTSKSPEQLKEAAREALHLIAGRLEPLADQYNQGMGLTKQPFELLRPDGQAIAARILGNGGDAKPKPAASGHSAEDAALLAKYGVK